RSPARCGGSEASTGNSRSFIWIEDKARSSFGSQRNVKRFASIACASASVENRGNVCRDACRFDSFPRRGSVVRQRPERRSRRDQETRRDAAGARARGG